jgi:glutathione S-transferase
MTEPTLFYTPGTCSLSGMVVLAWLGQPYRLVRVEGPQRASPAFRAINPLGQVPALQTPTGILVENSAILLYLCQDHPVLAPAIGTREGDLLQQWLSYLGSTFHVAFGPYFFPARFHPDPAQHEAVRQAALARVRGELAFVDAHLATSAWLLGDRQTILDPYLFAMARWSERLFDLPADHPHLAALLARLREDPAVQTAVALERGEVDDAPHLVEHARLAG